MNFWVFVIASCSALYAVDAVNCGLVGGGLCADMSATCMNAQPLCNNPQTRAQTIATCPMTCNACDIAMANCTDELENCKENAQLCDEQVYYAFMTRMCPNTCKRCLASANNTPKYTLYYFNLRNRGESIRLLFHYAQQPFADFRIEGKDWPSIYKPQMPWGHIPVLVEDCSFTLAQSTAILRYLAKKFGLEAYRLEDQALTDMYGEQLNDYITALVPWGQTFFDPSKAANRTQQFNALVPPIVAELSRMFATQLTKNRSGFLVGPKITWVDFLLAEVVDMLMEYGRQDLFNSAPPLLDHRRRILAMPTLQPYLRTRNPSVY